MLSCRNLNFSYGDRQVLHDVNLSFAKGSVIGLFGRNGSGKSTLLKMLGASLPIVSGELTVFGEHALDEKNYVKPSLRRHFGVLLQDYSSDEKISVKDNLLFAARLMGIDKKTAHLVAAEALKCAQLEAQSACLLKTLSGGMRRRLELYRTFMHNPRIVLLDEPTASLDFSQTENFLKFIRAYQERQSALVIFSTHRAREYEICDEVVMLDEGRIIAQNTPQNFLSSLNFMSCTFQLMHPGANAILADAGIKSLPNSDSDPLTLHAHLSSEELQRLLSDRALFSCAIRSFFVSKPNLTDAFMGLRGS